MKIFFVASECVPFSKTGGLADVVGALPQALVARGHQVSVFLPRYRETEPGPVIVPRLPVRLGRQLHEPAVQDGRTLAGARYFFLDYSPFYDREGLYVAGGKGYPDNPERFALFSFAALEFLQRQGAPDVMHCHDWQSALVPVLRQSFYARDPQLARVPIVLTVHNLGYQGTFSARVRERLGWPPALVSAEKLEWKARVNFLKGGLVCADFITTVSRKYAEEIKTPDYGCGLHEVLRSRADALQGILNGVDYAAWNPETDPFLVAHYSRQDLSGKQACKKDLLEQFGLPTNTVSKPVVGIISRFVSQKGFDLIADVADALMKNDLLLVALGTGERACEEMFRHLARRFPCQVGVRVAYDNALAHKIEAGSDIFLMPSRYEPCGLNQIYSLKYGTVPVVRATGGLDDTIEPFDPRSRQGTGFKFSPYAGSAMLECIEGALQLYSEAPGAWQRLVRNGMERDYSWGTSAGEYEELYHRLVRRAQTG
ncbi:MAG: glycogen synthase GlgA [Terriglobia bacterium]